MRTPFTNTLIYSFFALKVIDPRHTRNGDVLKSFTPHSTTMMSLIPEIRAVSSKDYIRILLAFLHALNITNLIVE